MPDDATLRISTVVDIGPLVDGMQEGAASVKASTQQMQSDFTSASATIAAALRATGVSAQDAASALRNQGFSAAEVAATMREVYAVQAADAKGAAELAAAESVAATGANEEAAAHLRNTGAIGAEVSARQAATASIGVFEGRTLSANRAAAAFLSTTLGFGPVLQAAFPVIGAIALADVLYQVIGAIQDATDALGGWDKEAQKAYSDALEANNKLYLETLHNQEAHQRLSEIGTKGLERIGVEATNAEANLQMYAKAAEEAAQRQIELNAALEHLEAEKTAALSADVGKKMMLAPLGMISAIADWSSYKNQIDEATESVKRNQAAIDDITKHQKELKEALTGKLPAEAKATGQEESDSQLEAHLQAQKRVQEAEVQLQEEGARRLYAIGKVTAAEEEALLELDAKKKLAIEEHYQTSLQAILSKHPDVNASRIEASRGEAQAAAVQYQTNLLRMQTETEQREEQLERQFARTVTEIRGEMERQEEETEKKGMEAFAKYQEERAKALAQAAATIRDEEHRHILAELEEATAAAQGQLQLGRITNEQELQQLKTLHEKEHEENLRFLEEQRSRVLALPDADTSKVAELAKINAEIEQENDRHNARMIADDQRADTIRQTLWHSFAADVNQGLNQIVAASITGGRNMQQAIEQALTGMLVHEAQFVAQWLLKKAEMWALDALVGRASQTAAAATTIVSDAAVAAAGAYAATAPIPFVGPILAPAAAAEAEASVLSFLAQASAQQGFDVPELGSGSMLTALHSREMVLPQEHADTIRGLSETPAAAATAAPDNSALVAAASSAAHAAASAAATASANGNPQQSGQLGGILSNTQKLVQSEEAKHVGGLLSHGFFGALTGFAEGGDVASDMIARLHGGEMVLPSEIAGMVRDMASQPEGVGLANPLDLTFGAEHADTIRSMAGREPSGADSHFHFHDHSSNQALDGEGLGAVLGRRKDDMAKHVEKLFRSGRLRRPH